MKPGKERAHLLFLGIALFFVLYIGGIFLLAWWLDITLEQAIIGPLVVTIIVLVGAVIH